MLVLWVAADLGEAEDEGAVDGEAGGWKGNRGGLDPCLLQTSAEERRRRGVGALAKGGGATAREAAAARERG